MSEQSEQSLIETAKEALSSCYWTVGECAAQWTKRYAKGRTDADFGQQVGLSGEQVYQRRRVWETFSDVSNTYSELQWSHFYVALTWDDSAECLAWADENQATVAEMKAWRRMQHGEDLTVDADEDNSWFDDAGSGTPALQVVPEGAESGAEPVTAQAALPAAVATAGPRATAAVQPNPERTAKTVAASLERCHRLLEDVDLRQLPAKRRTALRDAMLSLISDFQLAGMIQPHEEAA